jgi:hypothetical protein
MKSWRPKTSDRGRDALPRLLAASARKRDFEHVASLLHEATRWSRRWHRSGPSIIAMHKTGFNEDLATAFGRSADRRVAMLRRMFLTPVLEQFLPDEFTGPSPWGRMLVSGDTVEGPGGESADYSYAIHRKKYEGEAQELERFLAAVLDSYFSRVGCRRIVTGNFVYWAEQELQAAASIAGGRFLVTHKEALLAEWPRTAQAYTRALRSGVLPFRGTAMSTYSQQMKELLVGSGVVPAALVRVVGSPRVDDAHRARRDRRQAQSKRVTFFAMSQWIGLGFPVDPDPEPLPSVLRDGWRNTARGFAEAIGHLATLRSDLEIVVKFKSGPGSQSVVSQDVQDVLANVPETRRSRIRLENRGSGGVLAQTSAVTVCLNSTVALEALAAGRRVAVPHFGEVATSEAQGAVMDLGDHAERAASPYELARTISDLVDVRSEPRRGLPSGVEELLDRMVGNPDGKASVRLHQFLAHYR